MPLQRERSGAHELGQKNFFEMAYSFDLRDLYQASQGIRFSMFLVEFYSPWKYQMYFKELSLHERIWIPA